MLSWSGKFSVFKDDFEICVEYMCLYWSVGAITWHICLRVVYETPESNTETIMLKQERWKSSSKIPVLIVEDHCEVCILFPYWWCRWDYIIYRVHRVLENSLKVLEFWKKFQALESPWKQSRSLKVLKSPWIWMLHSGSLYFLLRPWLSLLAETKLNLNLQT